jgi:Phosphate-selective porin O and P
MTALRSVDKSEQWFLEISWRRDFRVRLPTGQHVLIVRYETFDPTILIDKTNTWTFGFNYLIKGDDLKLQLNYLLTDAAGILEKQNKVLCRFQVVF